MSSLKDLRQPDVVIIPGTKNTVEDFLWLQEIGLAQGILHPAKQNCKIVGICGGYQMLGETLRDEQAIEGKGGTYLALGLLPMETTFEAEKQTIQVQGTTTTGHAVKGYEIHLGRSEMMKEVVPFVTFTDGRIDGIYTEQIFGTYVHGIFQNRLFTRHYFNKIRQQKGLEVLSEEVLSDDERREQAYEMLDLHVRKHLDMDKIYNLIHSSV